MALDLEIEHESLHARGDGSEIVILKLLVLGRFVTHQGAAGQHQVGARGVEALVDKEVFLLPAEICAYMFHLRVKHAGHGGRGLVHAVEGAEQGSLVVEALAGVGNEYGGYAQGVADDEGRRRNVPGRISAGLESIAYASVGEARSVGLLLHEQLAVEAFDHPSLAVVLYERIMFLGGGFGQRLKPVGVVARAVVERPALHPFGHAVGHFARQRFLVVDSAAECLVGVGRQVFKHLLAVEHILAIILFGSFLRDFHRVGLAVERFVDHLESQ